MNINGIEIGGNNPCYIVADIGINANGSMGMAIKLIDAAKLAGCNAVKFQKRTIELQYTMKELAQLRESPFGKTNGDLKQALEFDYDDYYDIDKYCKKIDMTWFASVWDIPSVKFLKELNVPVYKIPSARNNDYDLLSAVDDTRKPIIISCGMTSLKDILYLGLSENNNLALMACTSSYPAKIEDLNLNRILTLKRNFPSMIIGYSGHEVGLWTTLCTVAMGAKIIERHITLDRTMFGSDQAASLEPLALQKLVREIRDFEIAAGSYELGMLPCEVEVAKKLKRKFA